MKGELDARCIETIEFVNRSILVWNKVIGLVFMTVTQVIHTNYFWHI